MEMSAFDFQVKRYLFVGVLLVLKICNCELNNGVHHRIYTNTTAMNFFRFRDFEPRNILKVESDSLVRNIRKSRGFQFHADDRDFNVELEFIVPFIRIPIERSVSVTQTAFRNLFNLNLHSIFATGAVVALGGLFAIILKIFLGQYIDTHDYRKSLRNKDAYQEGSIMFNEHFYGNRNSDSFSNIYKLIATMESKLQENNINISHCIQSSLCSYYQKNFCNTNAPNGGLPRLLDGIFSLDIIYKYLNGTAIKDALDSARNGDQCSKVFNKCNWHLPLTTLLNLLARNFESKNET